METSTEVDGSVHCMRRMGKLSFHVFGWDQGCGWISDGSGGRLTLSRHLVGGSRVPKEIRYRWDQVRVVSSPGGIRPRRDGPYNTDGSKSTYMELLRGTIVNRARYYW